MSATPEQTNIPFAWQRAISLVASSHQGQFRDNGVTPYASHPMRVAMLVATVFGIDDERILAAAVMHDLIEDTTVDYDEIAEQFDTEIADWVAAVSKDMRLPNQRREAEYDKALGQAPWQARLIKLGDVYDNLSDSIGTPKQAGAVKKAYRALALVGDAPQLQEPAKRLTEFMRTIGAGDHQPVAAGS